MTCSACFTKVSQIETRWGNTRLTVRTAQINKDQEEEDRKAPLVLQSTEDAKAAKDFAATLDSNKTATPQSTKKRGYKPLGEESDSASASDQGKKKRRFKRELPIHAPTKKLQAKDALTPNKPMPMTPQKTTLSVKCKSNPVAQLPRPC